jgi:hypothetical protein
LDFLYHSLALRMMLNMVGQGHYNLEKEDTH